MDEFKLSKLACLVAVACASSAAWSQDVPAAAEVRQVLPRLQIARDAETGEWRAPTAQEAAAMRAAPQAPAGAAARAAGKPSALPANHPMKRAEQAAQPQPQLGAVGRRFPMERMAYTVVRLDADGKPNTACVVGDDEAHKAMSSQAALGHKEHRHGH